ncbi:MAG: hypothetical protein HY908_17155 [Myxococcales bacterium]|nr:hypothetical protein [Myxococcales bacterium]
MSETTKIHHPLTVELGELVAAAFDRAALRSTDPHEVSRLATDEVQDLLRRAARRDHEQERRRLTVRPLLERIVGLLPKEVTS